MTGYFYDCTVHDDTVLVTSQTAGKQIKISFKRTVRVPDNPKTSRLPPDLGNFPLYRVRSYANSLPPEMVAKGGVFLPMYRREAMWIKFSATWAFAVKVYVGCVNAISGEPAAESASAESRRQLLVSQGKPVQDYMVVPGQRWLDGIASNNGVVKQFVATRLGEGYTVEAQITGHEGNGGLQIEITPAVINPSSIGVFVKAIGGTSYHIHVPPDSTFQYVQEIIFEKEGILPEEQRLIHGGKEMYPEQRLADRGLCDSDTIHVVMRLRGGGPGPAKPETKEMGIAAGGKIEQVIVRDSWPAGTWHKTATVAFNVQILNANTFEEVTGLPAPETPVTMDTYAELGLPFFKLYEEPGAVHGAFDTVKSIGEIDGVEERSFDIPTQALNDNPSDEDDEDDDNDDDEDDDEEEEEHEDEDISNPQGPLSEFRHVSELEQGLHRVNTNN